MIITLNPVQWAIITFYFLLGASIGVVLYLIVLIAIATVIEGIKWVLSEDKKI